MKANRRAAALSWFSLSGLSWRPARSSHFVAPRVGLFLARGGARAGSASDFELHFRSLYCVTARVAAPCQCRTWLCRRPLTCGSAHFFGEGLARFYIRASSSPSKHSGRRRMRAGGGGTSVIKQAPPARKSQSLRKSRIRIESSGHASENEFDVRKARS